MKLHTTIITNEITYCKQKHKIEHKENNHRKTTNFYYLQLLTYLLHGAESFWEANGFAASQGIPRISRNPKVHYRSHKRPPPVSILGPPNPVHTHILPPGDPS